MAGKPYYAGGVGVDIGGRSRNQEIAKQDSLATVLHHFLLRLVIIGSITLDGRQGLPDALSEVFLQVVNMYFYSASYFIGVRKECKEVGNFTLKSVVTISTENTILIVKKVDRYIS